MADRNKASQIRVGRMKKSLGKYNKEGDEGFMSYKEMLPYKVTVPKRAPVKKVAQTEMARVYSPYPDSEREAFKYLKFNNTFYTKYQQIQDKLNAGEDLTDADHRMLKGFVDKLDIQENNARIEREKALRLLKWEGKKTTQEGPLRTIPPRLQEGEQDRIQTYLENQRATRDANKKEIYASPRVLTMMRELGNYNKEEDEDYDAGADSAEAYESLDGRGMMRRGMGRVCAWFPG
jgi:hypothetical protein